MTNPETKVVVKQRVLYGSNQPGLVQRVALVYLQDKEYRVSAPPEAKGDALDWVSNLTVRQLVDFNSEAEIQDPVRSVVLKSVKVELERQHRDANRAEGMHPDGAHFDAQICLNGHILHCAGTSFDPKAHCTKCGAPGLDECPACGEPIRGVPFHTTIAQYSRPEFCHKCGQPYPWMEERLKAARELLEHDKELSSDDREKLWADLRYVMSDPKADLVREKKKLIEIRLEKATKFVREFILDLTAKTIAEVVKG